jgi:hypothetical protein
MGSRLLIGTNLTMIPASTRHLRRFTKAFSTSTSALSHHKPAPPKELAGLNSFPHLSRHSTIWMTNDAYMHANNSSYGEIFDTAVNQFLIRRGAMDFDPARRARLIPAAKTEQPVIGFMIESGYKFYDSFAYPG